MHTLCLRFSLMFSNVTHSTTHKQPPRHIVNSRIKNKQTSEYNDHFYVPKHVAASFFSTPSRIRFLGSLQCMFDYKFLRNNMFSYVPNAAHFTFFRETKRVPKDRRKEKLSHTNNINYIKTWKTTRWTEKNCCNKLYGKIMAGTNLIHYSLCSFFLSL